MAKRHHRLLSALLAALLLSSSAATASATTVGVADSGAGSLSKYYSTNAAGVGKEKTITVDGEIGDWDESMKIAQGTANDDPRVYRPNSMYEVGLDMYSLYGAYDDSNLYLMWEMTNVQDIVAPGDDYPLTQGTLYMNMNIPFFIALDTGKGDVIGNGGKTTTGGTIWDSGITFGSTPFNRLIAVSTNGANGPYVYGGSSDGLNPKETHNAKTSGITFKYGMGILSKEVWGLDGAYGATSSTNPRTVGDMCNDSGKWVDFNAKGHKSSSMDFHYEMAIPYDVLGVTKSDVASNGIGALVIMTSGKSGMDCLPYDLSMNDKADLDDSAGSQENNSFEKSDADDITCAFARIGNGEIPVRPSDTDKKDSDTVIDKPENTDSGKDTNTDTEMSIGWQILPLSKKVSKGETFAVKLGLENARNILGYSAAVDYETDRVELVSAKSIYKGVEVNKTKDGQVLWNVNLGDGKKGVDINSATPMVELTFKATKDIVDFFGTTCVRDAYDFDFKDIEIAQSILISKSEASDTDVQSDVDGNDMTINAKASKGNTVKVAFNADLSKVEGVSSIFNYDSSLLEYVGASKYDGGQVEVNQSTGKIQWNCINKKGSSKTDVVTFEFKAIKDVNGKVGTNTIKEIFDADSKDLSTGLLQAKVSSSGAEYSDTEKIDVVTDKKISISAKKGDRVVLTFDASQSKNAAGIQAVLDYDRSALKYNGDAASPFGVINADVSNGRIAWNILFDLNKNGGSDLSSKSEIAVMSFTAIKDINSSANAASYKVVDFYDSNDGTLEADNVSATAAVASRGEGRVPVTAKAGNDVLVACKAIDAKKALGIVEELTYDKSALTYLGYQNEVGHFDVAADTPGTLRWSTMFDAKGTDLSAETDLVVFKFTANKDIVSSDNVLSYVVDEFYDIDMNDFNTSGTTMVYAHAVSQNAGTPDADPVTSDTDSQGGSTNPTTSDVNTETGRDTDSSKPVSTDTNKDTDSSPVIHISTDTDTEGSVKVKIIYGDVDEDEDITAGDAVTVLRTSAELEQLEGTAAVAADVDEDQEITSQDSLSVLRVSVSLPTNTKAGQTVELTIRFK